MEDDFNILANGRRPQYLGWWKTTWICGHIKGNLNVFGTWKITSTFRKFKTTSMFWPMEDDLNILENGRWHQCFITGRWPQLLNLTQLAPAWPELGTAQPQLVISYFLIICYFLFDNLLWLYSFWVAFNCFWYLNSLLIQLKCFISWVCVCWNWFHMYISELLWLWCISV